MDSLYLKTSNKTVQPATAVATAGATVNYNEVINYNTYLILTPLFKSLIVSSTAGGKYDLNITDYKNGFYFIVESTGLKIKVPFKAIINSNDKIKGIWGISFSTARDCPSNKLGYCQLPDGELCYALKGEKQGSKKPHNFLEGMGSYYNGLLSIIFFNQFYINPDLRHRFIKFLDYYNPLYIRFNLKGDFKSVNDIKSLKYIATNWGGALTGYTARDDLFNNLIDLITTTPNIILNGSNIKYNNRFYATADLKEYLTADHPCLGGCLKNGCLNCYKLKGVIITALIHGSGSDTTLNNKTNNLFLNNFFKKYFNIDTSTAWGLNKGVMGSLNKFLRLNNLFEVLEVNPALLKKDRYGNLKFKDIKALLTFIKLTVGGDYSW